MGKKGSGRWTGMFIAIVLLATSCADAVVPEIVAAPSAESSEPVGSEIQAPQPELGEPELGEPELGEPELGEPEPEQQVEVESEPERFDFPVNVGWPDVARPYVDIVQQTRGEPFPDASYIRFVDEDVLKIEAESFVQSFDEIAPEMQARILRIDDVYRAMGLATTDFNVADQDEEIIGRIGAFYDPTVGEIVFPTATGEAPSEIVLRDRALLVHELTHALQDMVRPNWAYTSRDPDVTLALLEGEAEWVAGQFYASQPQADLDALEEIFAQEDLEDPYVPSEPQILQAEFATRYALGGRFFTSRFTIEGLKGIRRVFREDADAVSAQTLIDPWIFDGAATDEKLFPAPPLTRRGDRLLVQSDFTMNAIAWLRMFGAVLPAGESIAAARNINSLSLPLAWIDDTDRVCFETYVSASGEQQIVDAALAAWVAADPGVRWIEPAGGPYEGDAVSTVGGCDPGPAQTPDPRVGQATILAELAVVLDVEILAVEAGLVPRAGFCTALEGLDLIGFETQAYEAFNEWFEAIDHSTMKDDC